MLMFKKWNDNLMLTLGTIHFLLVVHLHQLEHSNIAFLVKNMPTEVSSLVEHL